MTDPRTTAPISVDALPRDLAGLRDRYVSLNASFARSRIHQFARGGGFCAETIGLLKSMLSCLSSDTQLIVGTHPEGRGFGLGQGWGDYFVNLFPTRRSRILDLANRHVYPANTYIPKPLARLAHAVTRRAFGAELLQFDPAVLPDRLVRRELGVDLDWWEACRFCLDLMWQMRPEVADAVASIRSGFAIKQPYIGIHLRRGDKSQEAGYVPLESYLARIGAIANPPTTVVIASDDAKESHRLASMLDRSFDVVSMARSQEAGYDQVSFNSLPAPERREKTIRFLTELETLRDAGVLLVSTSSNVGCLLQYLRTNQGIIDLDCPDDHAA